MLMHRILTQSEQSGICSLYTILYTSLFRLCKNSVCGYVATCRSLTENKDSKSVLMCTV